MAVQIKKTKSGKWSCIININNKQKTIVVGTKKAATLLKVEIELQVAREKLGFLQPQEKTYTFKEVCDEWLFEHQEEVRRCTIERYESALRIYILPFFGSQDITLITRPVILKHLKGLHRGTISGKYRKGYTGKKIKGVSASLINIITAVMSQTFIHAMDTGIAATTPMINLNKGLHLKKGKHTAEPFTQEQVELIINNTEKQWRLFIMFAFRTGCRLGECLGVHWDDIDLEKGTVNIQRSVNQNRQVGLTKNGRERTISLSPQLVTALQVALTEERKHYLKTPNGKGNSKGKPHIVFCESSKPVQNYYYSSRIRGAWKRALVKSEIPYIKFHHTRHTVASLLVAAGLPPKDVQHQLGHSSITMTMDLYAHYIQKEEAVTGVLDTAQG